MRRGNTAKKSNCSVQHQILKVFAPLLLVVLTFCACAPGQQPVISSMIPAESEASDSTVSRSEPNIDDEQSNIEAKTAQVSEDIPSIVEQVSPCVVLILNRKFYPLFFGEKNYDQLPRRYQDTINKYPAWSTGTGFIADKDGYIVTSYHVVQGAGTIFVFLDQGGEIRVQHGREYIAGLIYKDKKADIAIIKISAENISLPEVKLGDSSIMKRGEKILKIGYSPSYDISKDIISFMKQIDKEIDPPNSSTEILRRDNYYQEVQEVFQDPYLLGSLSVSEGIISAIRDRQGLFELHIDATISPGDSGCPLVNNIGEVIGISTQTTNILSSDYACQYSSWVHGQSKQLVQSLAQSANFAIGINEVKVPIQEAIALESPPLISGIRCDVRRWVGPYLDKETECMTELPPCVVVEWMTNELAEGKLLSIWNPFECPEIFETLSNDSDACTMHCGQGGGQYCRNLCTHPEILESAWEEQFTTQHGIIVKDLSFLDGSYEFKIQCRNKSGVEITSDEYRFLWTADPNQLFLQKDVRNLDRYCSPR